VETKDAYEVLVSLSDMYGILPCEVWYYHYQRCGETSLQMKKIGVFFFKKFMNFYFTSLHFILPKALYHPIKGGTSSEKQLEITASYTVRQRRSLENICCS
jgi:hypothetical protein